MAYRLVQISRAILNESHCPERRRNPRIVLAEGAQSNPVCTVRKFEGFAKALLLRQQDGQELKSPDLQRIGGVRAFAQGADQRIFCQGVLLAAEYADLELHELFPPKSGREEHVERYEIQATIAALFPRIIQQCGRYDKNMTAGPHALVVPLPSFESNLLELLESARALYDGRQSAAIHSMNQLYSRLSRVKGSRRYHELTLYLQQVLIACEYGDATTALDRLMSLFVRFISEPSDYQFGPESESELTA